MMKERNSLEGGIFSWRCLVVSGIMLSLVLLPIGLSGCGKNYLILKQSDLIYYGKAGEQPPTVDFDWTLLSTAKYRELTDR